MVRNSTSFKKGLSGNPKGRPPLSFSRKEFLNKLFDAGESEIDGVISGVISQAKQGNIQACKLIFEYLLPKPDAEIDENLMNNLTEEDNAKVYDFISSILPEDNIQEFVEATKKVTAFIKEIKSQGIRI